MTQSRTYREKRNGRLGLVYRYLYNERELRDVRARLDVEQGRHKQTRDRCLEEAQRHARTGEALVRSSAEVARLTDQLASAMRLLEDVSVLLSELAEGGAWTPSDVEVVRERIVGVGR